MLGKTRALRKQRWVGLLFLGYMAGMGLSGAMAVYAQVIPDSTVGTIVTSGPNFTITGGTRPANGPNLFHSFSQFSVPTGGSASFTNAPDVVNILSRVTGGSISNIDGLLQANGNANLFLINPAGIVFGPNAALNLGGSFLGTTATSLKFADGTEFSAANPAPVPLLTITAPTGLQMGQNPAAILVQGSGWNSNNPDPYAPIAWQGTGTGLQVKSGRTLALVGGDIALSGGYLNAPGGQIALGSGGTNAFVQMKLTDSGWLFDYQGVQSFQNIQITQAALIDTTADTGGSIYIQGQRIRLAEYSFIQSNTLGVDQGQPIAVRASEAIEVSNSGIITSLDGSNMGTSGDIYIEAPSIRVSEAGTISTAALGNTGNLTIQGKILELISPPDVRDGLSGISTATLSNQQGQGGTITINAEDVIGENWALIDGSTYGRANAGNVIINTKRLQLLNGAQFGSVTQGEGHGGNVTVNATESVDVRGFNTGFDDRTGAPYLFSSGIFTSSDRFATGNGGNLVINTGRLSVVNGGQISSYVARSGRGGDITIYAKTVEVADPIIDPTSAGISGLVTAVAPGAIGQGGNLNIHADSLRVFSGGQITAATDGLGNAGTIRIQAGSIDVSGISSDGQFYSSISARSSTSFSAGSIHLTSDRFSLRDRAEITVSNSSTGNAGSLALDTNRLFLDQATLKAEVNGGNQGNLQIQVRELLSLGHNSAVIANATGLSTGGNILISAPLIVAWDNSDVVANAVKGNGGNIFITTQGIFDLQYRSYLTPQNDITASSQYGVNGTVEIRVVGPAPIKRLAQFSVGLLDPNTRITATCDPNTKNTLTVTGRGGLSPDPTKTLIATGNLVWVDLRLLPLGQASQLPSETLSRQSFFPPTIPTVSAPTMEISRWALNPQGEIALLTDTPAEKEIGFLESRCSKSALH